MHKYRAKPQVTEDGRFDSKKELKRWGELKLLQQAGEIYSLTRDRKYLTFELHAVDGTLACKYVGDFRYTENGKPLVIIEDAKGMRTPEYKIKRKLFMAEYGHLYEHRES